MLLLTNIASIIDTVCVTKSHKKQHSRKYGSIVGLRGIETKSNAVIIAPNVCGGDDNALSWGVITPQAMIRAKATQRHGYGVK